MALTAFTGLEAASLGALVRRVDLWPVAVRVGIDLAPRRWWRRFPPLPLPDRSWMAFRMATAYGGNSPRRVSAQELVDYLEWCRDFPR